jgi:hypothetical protein
LLVRTSLLAAEFQRSFTTLSSLRNICVTGLFYGAPEMRIQVQTLGSGSVDFDIQETDTVAHVKKLLEEKEGISPEQLRLVAKGKVLRDNETLTAGTSIKVILVVRGGSCCTHV